MQILMSNKALENIDEIFAYLSNFSNEYANNTISNIYNTIDKLKDFPYIGRYVPNFPDKLLREKIYKEFRIIYFVSEKTNTVYIRYIFSSRQDSILFSNVHKDDLKKLLNQNLI